MKRSQWNTYAIYGYTYQAGTDARATGGVHLHQVRKTADGWQVRVVDSNGRFRSAGKPSACPDAEGERRYQTARVREGHTAKA